MWYSYVLLPYSLRHFLLIGIMFTFLLLKGYSQMVVFCQFGLEVFCLLNTAEARCSSECIGSILLDPWIQAPK